MAIYRCVCHTYTGAKNKIVSRRRRLRSNMENCLTCKCLVYASVSCLVRIAAFVYITFIFVAILCVLWFYRMIWYFGHCRLAKGREANSTKDASTECVIGAIRFCCYHTQYQSWWLHCWIFDVREYSNEMQ